MFLASIGGEFCLIFFQREYNLSLKMLNDAAMPLIENISERLIDYAYKHG